MVEDRECHLIGSCSFVTRFDRTSHTDGELCSVVPYCTIPYHTVACRAVQYGAVRCSALNNGLLIFPYRVVVIPCVITTFYNCCKLGISPKKATLILAHLP